MIQIRCIILKRIPKRKRATFNYTVTISIIEGFVDAIEWIEENRINTGIHRIGNVINRIMSKLAVQFFVTKKKIGVILNLVNLYFVSYHFFLYL